MIRALELKDVKKIVELEEEIFGETLGAEMLSNELSNPLVWFRVIENDDQIIGYIGGYFFDGTGEILNFLIDKKYQHSGFGTKLFNSLLDEARSKQIKNITLEVRTTNTPAINFYQKAGFEKIGIRKNYYKNGDDAIIMMKENI